MLYRKEINKKGIECFDKKIQFSMNLLTAMCYLKKAWNCVTAEVIKNCFRHGGFMNQANSKVQEMKKKTETEGLVKEAEKRCILSTLFICELCSN